MPRRLRRPLPLLVLAAVLGAAYAAAPPAKPDERPRAYEGKVVPLADVVAAGGTKLDADAAPHWLGLACDDGKVYPLVKDSASRLFFLDKSLLNRPMRLTARFVPGTTLLRVLRVQSLVRGGAHDVFYWCDVCSIRRGEKMICECCNGPMELREEPSR